MKIRNPGLHRGLCKVVVGLGLFVALYFVLHRDLLRFSAPHSISLKVDCSNSSVLFLKIPKTASSSLTLYLKDRFPEETCFVPVNGYNVSEIKVRYHCGCSYRFDISHVYQLASLVDEILSCPRKKVHVVLLVRDPLQRHTSEVFFTKMLHQVLDFEETGPFYQYEKYHPYKYSERLCLLDISTTNSTQRVRITANHSVQMNRDLYLKLLRAYEAEKHYYRKLVNDLPACSNELLESFDLHYIS